MPSRLNWQSEEDKLLKHLRNEEKIYSWHEIAFRVNSEFPLGKRSAKQCRERYSNTAQFCGQVDQNKGWSKEEDLLIYKLYLEYGPRWTLFMPHYHCRSENSIKNRYYSCLRKTARRLREIQEKIISQGRKSIKYEMLITILELANRVEKEAEGLVGQKPSEDLNLFILREAILRISFQDFEIECEEVFKIVQSLHRINSYLRCLGIFKTKKKGEWELSPKRLEYILSFQNKNDHETFDHEKSEGFTSNSSGEEKIIFQMNSSPIDELEMEMDFKIQESFNFRPQETWDFDQRMCELLGEDYLSNSMEFIL